MGSIFRQQYTAPDPADPTKRITKRSRRYYIQYTIGGRPKREPAYTDKAASLELLRQRESEVARGAVSLPSQHPLGQHIDEFYRDLLNRGSTPAYAAKTKERLNRICELGGIKTVPQITPSRVNAALAGLTTLKTTSKTPPPVSPSTRNHYLRAVKMFAKWLVDDRRAGHDAIRGMRFAKTAGHETRARRPLSPAEFARLLTVAAAGPRRERRAGGERVAVYLLASNTGYRRSELATIAPASFTFGPAPAVTLAAKFSKRRKPEETPLRADVAEFFRRYTAHRPSREPLWPALTAARTAEMIQADLTAAGIVWQDGREVVDFHCLRVTFITNLALAGVAPKVAQQLARHSTIDLTMNVYAKVGAEPERDAVGRLPAAPLPVVSPTPTLTPKLTQTRRKLVKTNSQPQSAVDRLSYDKQPTKPRKKPPLSTARRKTRGQNRK